MLEELYRFMELSRRLRLLHLPPSSKLRPPALEILEKAYLMQVRLDLQARLHSAECASQGLAGPGPMGWVMPE